MKNLFWGGRTAKSFDIYQPYVESALDANKLHSFETALYREEEQMYVQDLFLKKQNFLIEAIEKE